MRKNRIPISVIYGAVWLLVAVFGPSAGRAEPPRGMTPEEAADFAHLSEGADVFPYEWLATMRSATFKGQPLLADFDRRFGIARGPSQRQYLMSWIGLTTAWSDAKPTEAEATRADAAERVRTVDGRRSIKMVGTNCALCHSNVVEHGSFRAFVPGAPAIVNVRGFFQDLAKSTMNTLADREALIAFLEANQVPDAPREAASLRSTFFRRLGEDTGELAFLEYEKHSFFATLSGKATLAVAKLLDDRTRLYRGKKAIAEALEKLLRVTYGFGRADDLGALPKRMEFLAQLCVGRNPQTQETTSGYGRTDAFGRISNLVARGEKPIDYTAPVSFPWLWGMRDTAEMHYNANSNSVLARNIGQTVGLGSILLDDQGASTTNLHNLARLEQLCYQVETPRWEKVFAGVPALAVNQELAARGKPVFEKTCKGCHHASGTVGPQGDLLTYRLFPLEKIGTDPTYARNIVTPVNGRPLSETILGITLKMRDAYYRKWNVSDEEQARWEDRARRGESFFRDTLLGDVPDGRTKAYESIRPGLGHRARNLAGVWATGPFLHNGSVPSVAALLGLEPRPVRFLVRSRQIDPERLGFRHEGDDGFRGVPSQDDWYDTRYPGNSNAGHMFGQDLPPADKRAVIEYLKVLE